MCVWEQNTVEGWHLVVWGAAETATAIVAASIPVLRLLGGEAKPSRRRRQGYYAQQAFRKGLVRTTVIVAVGAGRAGRSSAVKDDDQSDWSILQYPVAGNRIWQTQEVAVEYHERGELDDCLEYEMGRVGAEMV